ncbi:lasso peptide biosynthesis PqqD family chaperone [Amycolatopsis magusensis]|uniref:Coenzyme PQQ synthesis protein D (PqqD) n=1 Tax=Amycolatopsis magusensis TaxID=882444 RepID=A0ABS4Q1B4_9PSEU|nr:lasso peptide biosynthesis PqqD family chaperone [Amycolatopsis magusensis]MBP2185467.1 hypothetical protein [Amycolatopsis magusensis]MDI5976096.1 lasso peptide biosynthesis PqqD family chaperone [Amycolatopsis magusensis]
MSLELENSVSQAETDGGLALLDERSGQYWQLNETAGLVLRLLLGGASEEEAVVELTNRYQVEPIQAGNDVCSLVASLKKAKLARYAGLPAGRTD